MGFLHASNDLLDETSDNSLEKELATASDQVENKLGQTLDQSETGVESVEGHTRKTINIVQQ